MWAVRFSCGRTTFKGSPPCWRVKILTSLEHWIPPFWKSVEILFQKHPLLLEFLDHDFNQNNLLLHDPCRCRLAYASPLDWTAVAGMGSYHMPDSLCYVIFLKMAIWRQPCEMALYKIGVKQSLLANFETAISRRLSPEYLWRSRD